MKVRRLQMSRNLLRALLETRRPAQQFFDTRFSTQFSSPGPKPQNSTGTETQTASVRHIIEVSNRAPQMVDTAKPDGKCSIYRQIHTSSGRGSKAVGLRNLCNLGPLNVLIELIPFGQVSGWDPFREDSCLVNLLAPDKYSEIK